MVVRVFLGRVCQCSAHLAAASDSDAFNLKLSPGESCRSGPEFESARPSLRSFWVNLSESSEVFSIDHSHAAGKWYRLSWIIISHETPLAVRRTGSCRYSKLMMASGGWSAAFYIYAHISGVYWQEGQWLTLRAILKYRRPDSYSFCGLPCLSFSLLLFTNMTASALDALVQYVRYERLVFDVSRFCETEKCWLKIPPAQFIFSTQIKCSPRLLFCWLSMQYLWRPHLYEIPISLSVIFENLG
jgi:hypothetical protein